MAKRFAWRLEPVRRLKGREEEQKQQELAEALARLQAVLAEQAGLGQKQTSCRDQLRQLQTGRLNTADILYINTYLEDLARRHRELETRLKDAQDLVGQKRESLMKTVREKQVLDNLRERDHRAFLKEERRLDQAAMDEIAGRKRN